MTLYGLPEKVEFCKKCTISNQRPNSCEEFKHTFSGKKETIKFTDGVCDACLNAHKKNEDIDWAAREKQLLTLLEKHRRPSGYDCIVAGSGGKDSFYAAWMMKYKYGMNPLTVTWAPTLYTDVGRRNHKRWIDAGFDNITVNPNGKVHRLLTRLSVENLFHPFQTFILGQKQVATKMAMTYNVPLVIYGENEAEYGNPLKDNSSALRDWKYFTTEDPKNIYLGGASLETLEKDFGVGTRELALYLPDDPEQIRQKQIEVHYLGYYLKWHPQSCFYHAVEHGGFEVSQERTAGTYSKYNSIDDKIDDFHYYCTYIKFGIGRATYDSAQEIRSGDITREEGVALVKRFDGEYPDRFEKEIFEYLSVNGLPTMTREYFKKLEDKFKPPHLWDGDKLRHTIFS